MTLSITAFNDALAMICELLPVGERVGHHGIVENDLDYAPI